LSKYRIFFEVDNNWNQSKIEILANNSDEAINQFNFITGINKELIKVIEINQLNLVLEIIK